MSLKEEVARYEHLTGKSAEHIPIIKIGSFLDGVDKGIEELEKIKVEIQFITEKCLPNNLAEEFEVKGLKTSIEIIDKHIEELKGEQK